MYIENFPSFIQLMEVEENELAPNWYDVGAGQSRKRPSSASTKDLEKKKQKKAATSTEEVALKPNTFQKR